MQNRKTGRQQKAQRRKAQEGDLKAKRQEMDRAVVRVNAHYHHETYATQVADSVKRYSYLVGQTELFKHFVDLKAKEGCVSRLPPPPSRTEGILLGTIQPVIERARKKRMRS
jgi:hypothetical protein